MDRSSLGFVAGAVAVRGWASVPCVSSHRELLLPAKRVRRLTFVSACAETQQTVESESTTVSYQDDGTRVVPVPLFILGTEDESVSGVYGVLNIDRELMYVGMSRNVADSLSLHSENEGDEAVKYTKVMTFALPKASEMKMVVDTWINENGSVPLGNQEGWEEFDAELAYEASLLETAQFQPGDIVSPFEKEDVAVTEVQEMLELSISNVDTVLDEVRPYLISDGGNISVHAVDIESRKVELRLEGACGSCSSAAMTMQMGVEKALRAKFGDNIGEVLAVPTEDPTSSDITVASCEAVLDEVRAALRGLGGSVKVLEVDEDEVIVSFNGPSNLRYGIELMLKDKIPGIEAVTFE